MPEEIAKRHIQTWTKEGELVYDPFSGSGTTAKVALEMNRMYLGSELNTEYYNSSLNLLNETKNKLHNWF
jgi:site-specific DNA-methyltransferase (adenine-specific)